MKPCSNNRKPIACLTMGALDARQERALRAHLETCEGCRGYLAEISGVTEKLAAVEIRSDVQTSESFHRKVAGALRAAESGSTWETVASPFRTFLFNWRVALPTIGAAVAVIAAFFVFQRHPGAPSPAPLDGQTDLAPAAKSDPDPTISNYQMVANRSLEKLDELLTRQGNQNPSPTPIYTASTLPRTDAPD